MHSRLKLIAIAAAFFGPFLIATLLYFSPQTSLVPQPKSHGELISPPTPLVRLEARDTKLRPLPQNTLLGKWTLAYWNDEICALWCQTELFKMRQVRLSLGRDLTRLQTLYFAKPTHKPALTDPLSKPLNTLHLRNPQLIIAKLIEQSKIEQQMNTFPLKNIYLIDPLGNVMMRYSKITNSKGMLKDIKKLFKISKVG